MGNSTAIISRVAITSIKGYTHSLLILSMTLYVGNNNTLSQTIEKNLHFDIPLHFPYFEFFLRWFGSNELYTYLQAYQGVFRYYYTLTTYQITPELSTMLYKLPYVSIMFYHVLEKSMTFQYLLGCSMTFQGLPCHSRIFYSLLASSIVLHILP